MQKRAQKSLSSLRKGLRTLRARIRSHLTLLKRKRAYASVRNRPATPYAHPSSDPDWLHQKPLPPLPGSLSTVNISLDIPSPAPTPVAIAPAEQPVVALHRPPAVSHARSRNQEQQQQQQAINTSPMAPATLAEALGKLSAALSHIPHALCGRAALATWGYTDKPVRRLTVSVPESSHAVLRSWAAASGMLLVGADTMGLMTADGVLRKVSLRFVPDDDFAALRVVERVVVAAATPARAHAVALADGAQAVKVLGLSALLDCAARAWRADWRARGYGWLRESLAEDCVWVLRRLVAGGFAEAGAERLRREAVPHVADYRFLAEFVAEQPCALGLLADAGLAVAGQMPLDSSGRVLSSRMRRRRAKEMARRMRRRGMDSRYGWTGAVPVGRVR